MIYLLDTDTLSYAIRGQGRVAETLIQQRRGDLAVSSITVAELEMGERLRPSRRLRSAIEAIIEGLEVLAFDRAAAAQHGKIAAQLSAERNQIGAFDTLIAAHALSLRLTLVTHNTRHFDRVRGLRVVDWV